MVLRSRNTMVTSAVLFLIVVILLRFTGGFLEDNIVRVVGSIFGGSAESIPLIDFGSIDLSWMNPANWSMDDTMEAINQWFHDVIDSVLPAFIHTLNIGVITAVISRTKLLSVVVSVTKATPVVL